MNRFGWKKLLKSSELLCLSVMRAGRSVNQILNNHCSEQPKVIHLIIFICTNPASTYV